MLRLQLRLRFTAPRPATALAILLTCAAACTPDPESAIETRGKATSYVLAEQIERGVGTEVNLADLAPFRWERLYVFGPGTAVSTVRDSIHVPWPGLTRYGRATPDTASLLVFVAGGQVIAAVAHPRTHGDVAPSRVGRGYSPAEAVFRVDSVGPAVGRRVLR